MQKKNPLLQSGIFCSKGSVLRLPKLLQILFWLLHPSHLDTWWQFQQWTNVGSCFSKSSVSSVPSVKGEIVCTPISKGLKVQFTSWISRLTFENNICVTNTRSAIYSKKHKNGTSIKGALHKRFANAGQWGPHSHAFTTTCKSLSTVVNKSPLACATWYYQNNTAGARGTRFSWSMTFSYSEYTKSYFAFPPYWNCGCYNRW